MANAIVRLTGSATHSARGRTFKKGYPQTLTDKGEIEYYRRQGGFTVQDVGAKPPTPPTPPVEEPPTEPEPEATEDDEEEEVSEVEMLTKSQLKDMTKAKLILAGEERLVLFTGSEKKGDMVAQILAAQEQLAAEEDDGDDGDE